jgi:hypothetical protein
VSADSQPCSFGFPGQQMVRFGHHIFKFHLILAIVAFFCVLFWRAGDVRVSRDARCTTRLVLPCISSGAACPGGQGNLQWIAVCASPCAVAHLPHLQVQRLSAPLSACSACSLGALAAGLEATAAPAGPAGGLPPRVRSNNLRAVPSRLAPSAAAPAAPASRSSPSSPRGGAAAGGGPAAAGARAAGLTRQQTMANRFRQAHGDVDVVLDRSSRPHR